VHAAAALDALYKKSSWLEGIRVKNHHYDGAKRVFDFFVIHY
jgi:hypothetical protein